MKILGIAANFLKFGEERPPIPQWQNLFIKASSSLHKGDSFTYPKFSDEVWHEMELTVKISRQLKNANLEDASNAYDEIALGMDWTAKDIQNEYKTKGWPWAVAKSFDQATMVSDFYPREHFGNPENLDLRFEINGEIVEKGNTKDLKISVAHIIQFASRCMTLHPGDLIMTGAPPSPGPIKRGDVCKGFIHEECLLDFKVI